jgi:hypothetical protein
VIPRVMLDEVLLSVVDPIASNDWAGPVLARLVHPHFMLFPIRLGFEGLETVDFCAVCTEHEGIPCLALALAPLAMKSNRGGDTDAILFRRGEDRLRLRV